MAFIITTIGHLFGAWEEHGAKLNICTRIWLAVINLLGFLILFLTFQKTDLWPLSIAIVCVVVLYLGFTIINRCKTTKRTEEQRSRGHCCKCLTGFIAAILLFVVLGCFSFSSCGKADPLGGPYPIGGKGKENTQESIKLKEEKNAEFNGFKSIKQWNATKVAKLTPALFIDSIYSNRLSNAPYADQFQRYNYVIKKGEVFVAIWNTLSPTDICNGVAPYQNMQITSGVMVNFYPESLKHDLPPGIDDKFPSPSNEKCIYTASKGKRTGALDAQSKHFMLVQGEGVSITNYDPARWDKEKVDYAGEILVRINPCEYIINEGSGTYKPDPKYLVQAAKIFERVVSEAPAQVWNTQAQNSSQVGLNTKLNCNGWQVK